MDIQNVKATLGRVRARGATRGALIIRQGSACIDVLSEALPLAPTPRYQKPVLLVLGVAPALVGAVEVALRAMRIDLPAVQPPAAAPDYRGAVALTLAEALGRDLARGDNTSLGIAFSRLLANALETVGGPWREGEETARGLAIAPLLAVIALSGLALAYEELRADGGAAAVRQAWGNASTREWSMARQAQAGLDALDEEEQGHLSMHAWRWFAMVVGWQEALAEAIADHGLAYVPSPSGPPQAPRGAPPGIRIVGVSPPPFPGFTVTPAELAGALILAPLSGETDEQLRSRPTLRAYFAAFELSQ